MYRSQQVSTVDGEKRMPATSRHSTQITSNNPLGSQKSIGMNLAFDSISYSSSKKIQSHRNSDANPKVPSTYSNNGLSNPDILNDHTPIINLHDAIQGTQKKDPI